MNGTCVRHGEETNACSVLVGNREETDRSELGVVLKWVLKEYGGKVWTEYGGKV